MQFPSLTRLLVVPMVISILSGAGLQVQSAERGKFIGARDTLYPEWFKDSFLDLREDIADAAGEGRRVVIFFHQNGCPYCNLMVERNLSQKDIQDIMRKDMDVIELNMFGDREVTNQDGNSMTEKEFAAAMKVQFTPTLLFFDEQGKVILRLNGYIPPQNFKLALEYVRGGMEREVSYRKYLAQNRPPAPAGSLAMEDFFLQPPYLLKPGGKKPLIILFEQRQCPDCDRLHEELLPDPEIRRLLQRYNVVQLDMWSETPLVTPGGKTVTAREWARELGVIYAPTLMIMDAGGVEIIRSEAVFKRFHTASILDYGLDGSYLEEPSFQRYLSARSEHIREQGKDVDIWK